MLKDIYYIILLFPVVSMYAQDTSYVLPTAVIRDSMYMLINQHNRQPFTDGQYDIMGTNGLLSEDIIYFSGGVTRSNGPGKVTTFTKHGLPTEHSKVYWKDIEINSPLNGVVDFSTLPVFLLSDKTNLFDQQQLQINLQPAGIKKAGTLVSVNAGSFSTWDLGARHQIGFGKNSLEIGGLYTSSKSDFKYENDLGKEVKQNNSDYRQYHLMMNYSHAFSTARKLSLNLLYSNIDTDIPPTIFQRNSSAEQKNKPLKIQASYEESTGNHSLKIYTGANVETLQYINPDLDLNANHQFYRISAGGEYQKLMDSKVNRLTVRFKQLFESGTSDNFSETHKNRITKADVGINFKAGPGLEIRPQIGIQYGRDILSPLLYNLNVSFIPAKGNKIELTAKSVFRLPTYNELYWEPGGNIDLDPENGHAAFVDYLLTRKHIVFEAGAAFHRLKNRIIWTPGQNGIFSPVNVGRIGSEELYGGLNFIVDRADHIFNLNLRYTFLHAHIVDSDQFPDREGNSLPYTPTHSLGHQVGYTFRKHSRIKLNGKFQSKSYINLDNSRSLDPFYLLDIKFERDFLLKKNNVRAHIAIKNITNQTYYLTSGYPQPGIHWNAGLIIQLN